MDLKNTQTKLGKEEGMSHNGTGPHARFKGPVRNTEMGTRERQNGNAGPAGRFSVVVTVGARVAYILGKRPPSFLCSSFGNKPCGTDRRSQSVSE